jgi:hypothetical protein
MESSLQRVITEAVGIFDHPQWIHINFLQSPFMKASATSESTCRRCRYYVPEGRRGGYCRQLGVNVQSNWKACAVAIPPFSPTWESLEGIMAWQEKALAALESSNQSSLRESEPATRLDEVAV